MDLQASLKLIEFNSFPWLPPVGFVAVLKTETALICTRLNAWGNLDYVCMLITEGKFKLK